MFRCFLHILFLNSCALCSLLAEEASINSTRITLRNIEAKGVGYNRGYTTLEGFFSPTNPWDKTWVPFLDIRGHLFNNGKPAANAGIGGRYISSSRVWGVNAYYDYRKTNHFHYNQISMGLESLGKTLDYRLNGYLPFGDKISPPFSHTKFAGFKTHYAYLLQKREFSMKGANAEMGAHVDKLEHFPLYFAAGPYYLRARKETAWGGKLRASTTIYNVLQLEAITSYDNVFKWIGQGQLGLILNFGKKEIKQRENRSYCQELILANLAVQPVYRNEIIPVDVAHQNVKAIDPATKKPYFFWFVDNTSHSNGTFESPFNTLIAAQNASSEGDNIYIFPGDGTTTGMDAGITLKNRQSLLGAATAQILQTQRGALTIPPLASQMPSLTAPAGTSVINVANNNLISGLQIATDASGNVLGSYCIGSSSGTTANLSVFNNMLTVNNGSLGISPSNPCQNITIVGNIIESTDRQGTFGIYLAPTYGSGVYYIAENNISNFQNKSIFPPAVPTGTGIEILVQNQSNISTTLVGNQVSNCYSRCIDLRAGGTGTPSFFAVLNDNTLLGQGHTTGIFLRTDNAATGNFKVFNNVLTNNPFGIIAQAEDTSFLTGFIHDNQLSHGSASGIILETNLLTSGSATGAFTVLSNTISGFDTQGIATNTFANSSFSALIQNNTIFNQGKAGLYLIGKNFSNSNLVVKDNIIQGNNGGMEVDPNDHSTISMLLQGNTIFNNNGAGLFSLPSTDGSGTYKILSNTFYNNNLSSLNSGSAITIVPANSSSVCLRMLDNQSTTEATLPDYFLQNNSSGLFNLEPLVGNTGTIFNMGTTPVPPNFCGP